MPPTITTTPQKSFSVEIQQLAAIRKMAVDAAALEKGAHAKLLDALAETYALTRQLRDKQALRAFVEEEGYSWSKKAIENPFFPVVVLGFREAPIASISKYAAVLLHADLEGVVEFKPWYSAKNLNDHLKAARARGLPDQEEYSESLSEQLERGLVQLRGQRLGTALKVDPAEIPTVEDVELPELNQYRRALLRVGDDGVEVVKFLEGGHEELRAEVLAIAGPEGTQSSRKLRAKPLYDLFRVCDLAVRLTDKANTIYDDEVSFALEEGVSIADWEEAIRNRTRQAKERPFTLRRGIRLFWADGQWCVERVSNELTFACYRSKLTSQFPELDTAKEYLITDSQAMQLSAQFRAAGDWLVRPRRPSDINQAIDTRELALNPFQPSMWRHGVATVDPAIAYSPVERFRLTDMLGWQKEHKDFYVSSLPKLLAFAVGNATLTLWTEIGKAGDEANSRVLMSRDFSSFSPEIGDRRIRRNDLIAISEIVKAYDEALEATFGLGNEGLVSLQVKLGETEITIPLAVSLSGDYAEVAGPV